MKIVIETERLILREFIVEDAPFILQLLNTPSWLQFIGYRGVDTLKDAENYLVNVYFKSYEKYGFGFYAVVVKGTNESIGMCGLVKRDTLDDVDIGFAFMPNFVGKGYGFEAASATLNHAENVLKLEKVVAIVDPKNEVSIALIKKIGLQYEKMVQLSANDIEIMLFTNQYFKTTS